MINLLKRGSLFVSVPVTLGHGLSSSFCGLRGSIETRLGPTRRRTLYPFRPQSLPFIVRPSRGVEGRIQCGGRGWMEVPEG